MENLKVILDILKELSPFQQKYFFIVFGFFLFLVSMFLPINEYSGFSIKSRTQFLDTHHRILFDCLLFVSVFMSFYILLRYKSKNISKYLKYKIYESIHLIDISHIEKTGKPIKSNPLLVWIIYGFVFSFMFFIPASKSPRYYEIYQGNIIAAFIFVSVFYLIFISLVLLIIWSCEVKFYVRKKGK